MRRFSSVIALSIVSALGLFAGIAQAQPCLELCPLSGALMKGLAYTPPSPGVLVATGAPIVAPTGPIGRDSIIVAVPVRHGLTGVLAQPLARLPAAFKKDLAWPPGTKVYGIPLADNYGMAKLMWCAPEQTVDRKGAPLWRADCFVPQANGMRNPNSAVWVPESFYGLFNSEVVYSALENFLDAPARVTPGPVDFAPMEVVVSFVNWTRRSAFVYVSVRWDGGFTRMGRVELPRDAAGNASLAAFGAEFRLNPLGSDDKAATLTVLRSADELPERFTVAPG